jgi:phosphoribosyl 1,2-cyclic phosphodiesterase
MLIKIWGVRGSVPVSGAKYVKYGGDTTCIEIRTRSDDTVIIDAGTGIRRLGNLLMREKRLNLHMIFTHAHWDHIVGLPFFKPIYHASARITVYRCPISRFVDTMYRHIMTPPYFPVRFSDSNARLSYAETTACNPSFRIGPLTVEPIPLSHPNTGMGYRFTEDGKRFVFLTDNELHHPHPGRVPYAEYVRFARHADLLFHDAEYTAAEWERHISWGHSSYLHALDLAIDAGASAFGLVHHNQDRYDHQVDGIELECRQTAAERGAALECFAARRDMEIVL